jgi:hypothetical protein
VTQPCYARIVGADIGHSEVARRWWPLRLNRWPEQPFVDRPTFDKFIEFLSGYDDCFRITDRWWTALAELAGHVDEEGFIRTEVMADKLMEAFEEANSMHAQWAPKK